MKHLLIALLLLLSAPAFAMGNKPVEQPASEAPAAPAADDFKPIEAKSTDTEDLARCAALFKSMAANSITKNSPDEAKNWLSTSEVYEMAAMYSSSYDETNSAEKAAAAAAKGSDRTIKRMVTKFQPQFNTALKDDNKTVLDKSTQECSALQPKVQAAQIMVDAHKKAKE